MLHLILAATLEAQTHFNAGLADLFAYAGPQAVTQFEEAEDAGDNSLAWWGEALAEGSDLNTPLTPERFKNAHATIAGPLPRSGPFPDPKTTSERDRLLIAAVTARYAGTYDERVGDEKAYRIDMEAIVAKYPDDDDAAMFLVEDLLEQQGMHWNEDGTPLGDTSAEILKLIQTTLAHNPQHLFANHLCIHAYDTAPDRTFAIACAQRLDAMTFSAPMEHLVHMPAHTWLEIGDGKAALASSERSWALNPTRYALHDASVAYSSAWMCGDDEGIARWVQRIGALIGKPYTVKTPEDLVAAKDLEAAGKVDQAIATLRKAAQSLTDAGENIPPFPADVRIGAVYYRAGRYTQARDAFLAVLRSRPRDPRALFGAAETYDRLGDPSQATRYRKQFAQYWAGGRLTIRDF